MLIVASPVIGWQARCPYCRLAMHEGGIRRYTFYLTFTSTE
jgi:hypothetical protein